MPKTVEISNIKINQVTIFNEEDGYVFRIDYSLVDANNEPILAKAEIRSSSTKPTGPFLPAAWETKINAMLSAIQSALVTSEGI